MPSTPRSSQLLMQRSIQYTASSNFVLLVGHTPYSQVPTRHQPNVQRVGTWHGLSSPEVH